MNIHFLQHVAFEGLASIEPLLLAQGHNLSATHLYMGQTLPESQEFDALIIMGGPMGVNDELQYPWLTAEKAFIQQAINDNKKILGICLGAQLLANVLGAKISKNPEKEIGWFPLDISAEKLKSIFPKDLEVFHWHGETFTIPDGATALGSSQACSKQGFIIDERIIALQFHLETTKKSAQALLQYCADDLDHSPFVQTETQILSEPDRFIQINRVMCELLMLWLKA